MEIDSMKITIEFNLDNDAYSGESLAAEICYTLKHYMMRTETQSRTYLLGNGNRNYLKDSNGNTVGFATITDIDEPEDQDEETDEETEFEDLDNQYGDFDE